MRRREYLLALTPAALSLAGCAGGGSSDGESLLTNTSATGTPTEQSPTGTATAMDSSEATPPSTAATESATQAPTRTETETATPTATATSTETPTATPTAEPADTPAPTETSAATPTPTPTRTPTPTPTPQPDPLGQTVYVARQPVTYSPSDFTISPGFRVRWVWEGDAHNIVVDGRPNDADWKGTPEGDGELYEEGYVYERTFHVPGRYSYHCSNHQEFGMMGTFTVE